MNLYNKLFCRSVYKTVGAIQTGLATPWIKVELPDLLCIELFETTIGTDTNWQAIEVYEHW